MPFAANVVLARQFRKFRKRFHFTQTELGQLLERSRDFVSDVETVKYKSIHAPTLRLFLALKQRHEEAERQRKSLRKRRKTENDN